MRTACLLLIAAGAAWAQLNPPALGWTPDGAAIRPMFGLPGAGALGSPVNLGRNLANITTPSGYVLATDAASGQPLLIVNGTATPIAGVDSGASSIAVSPTGSSAAFWFSSTKQFEVVSGLLTAPSVRDVDASFLASQPIALAVSDDGQSLAASFSTGAWLFNAAAVSALPVNQQIDAIAFLPLQSTVIAATAEGVLSIANNAVSMLYDWSRESARRDPLPPITRSAAVGIAASSDAQHVVMATGSGEILALNLSAGTSTISSCNCTPEGVFPLTGSAFRLTSPSSGEVKLFDSSSDSVFVVPPMLSTVASQAVRVASKSSAALPALPAVTIGGIPTTTGYEQQPAMTISIASPYSAAITGTVTMTFASSVGGDDQMIQFVSPTTGRTASFTIPAGSTQALFGSSSSLTFDTGTVAGTITFTLDFMASGTDITPTPAPSKTYTTNPTVPFISLVTLEQTSGGVTVFVTGFSSTRDMTSGSFQFAPATGKTISNPTVSVSLSSAFNTWYSNTSSYQYGSQFTLTMPFPVQGEAGDIVSVVVTLTNSKGTSNSATLSQ